MSLSMEVSVDYLEPTTSTNQTNQISSLSINNDSLFLQDPLRFNIFRIETYLKKPKF